MAHTSTVPMIPLIHDTFPLVASYDLERLHGESLELAIELYNSHAERMEAEHTFAHEIGDRVMVPYIEKPQIVVGRGFAKIYSGCDAHILAEGAPSPCYELMDEGGDRKHVWECYEDGVLPLDKDRPLTVGEVQECWQSVREAFNTAKRNQDNSSIIKLMKLLGKLHQNQKKQIWAMLTPAERSAIKAALA